MEQGSHSWLELILDTLIIQDHPTVQSMKAVN